MDAESTSSVPVSMSDSPSSTAAEATNSDSQELSVENENPSMEKILTPTGKERRINRRIALAMARSQQAVPSPIFGKSSSSLNKTIDLTVEDDDPTQKWFKKTFEKHEKPRKMKDDNNVFAVPADVSKNVPKSLKVSQMLKKRLEASLSVKRKQGQEQRRQQYLLDNAHILNNDSEEDEEEAKEKSRKSKKSKRKRIENTGYVSEDDEDYKVGESGENSSDSEFEGDQNVVSNTKKIDVENSSPDIFGSHESEHMRADDEMSVNVLDDSFTYDVFSNVKHQSGPGSTVSTFDSNQRHDDFENNGALRFGNMMDSSSKNDSQSDLFGDILSLCSGRFDSIPITTTSKAETVGDQLLEETPTDSNEERNEKKIEEEEGVISNYQRTDESKSETSDDEEENISKKVKKNVHRKVDSDDENDDFVKDSVENDLPETVPLSTSSQSMDCFVDESIVSESVEVKAPRRIVLSDDDSDDEEDIENDKVAPKENEEPAENEEEEEIDEEEEEEEEEIEEPEPNFDDEDDELAVLKRIEYQEYKTKSKKKNFFDDEASLSGDDVGSELDDEEGEVDEYEAEEGDADDVPDNSTIGRQNHQLLMRQEAAKEQRALLKLQDRLLADGDLGGVDTNRQFRFKIRQEEEAKILAFTSQAADDEEEDKEQEEDDDTEEKRVERAKMLKFRIEKAEELMLLDEPKAIDDPFERAGRLVRSTKEQMTVTIEEENVAKNKVVKPSLLRKSLLGTSIQEVIVATGSSVPKQMYVQNYNSSVTTSVSSRPSTGAMKRGRSSPDAAVVKKVRQSKLSVLE